VIDGILTSRELTLQVEGANSDLAATKIEAHLLGHISADRMLRVKSKLSVTGTKRTPFAFTCLEMLLDREGYFSQFMIGSSDPKLNALPVESMLPVPHVELGGADDLIAFDN
jgi:hypothetical protein